MRKKIYMEMMLLSCTLLVIYAILASGTAFVLYRHSAPAVSYIVMLVLWLFVCAGAAMVSAGKMTKKIVRPIQKIDLSHPEKGCVYEEIQPMMTRIVRQKKLRQKNEKLRQEFSSNVSHELKTPLTSISGYAELLKNGLVPPQDIPEFSEKIYKEANHMICRLMILLSCQSLTSAALILKRSRWIYLKQPDLSPTVWMLLQRKIK